MPTVITGNLSLEQLADQYRNKRLISRIESMVAGTEIVLDAKPDWRTMTRRKHEARRDASRATD